MSNDIVMKGKPRMILKAYCNLMEMPLFSSGLSNVATFSNYHKPFSSTYLV